MHCSRSTSLQSEGWVWLLDVQGAWKSEEAAWWWGGCIEWSHCGRVARLWHYGKDMLNLVWIVILDTLLFEYTINRHEYHFHKVVQFFEIAYQISIFILNMNSSLPIPGFIKCDPGQTFTLINHQLPYGRISMPKLFIKLLHTIRKIFFHRVTRTWNCYYAYWHSRAWSWESQQSVRLHQSVSLKSETVSLFISTCS